MHTPARLRRRALLQALGAAPLVFAGPRSRAAAGFAADPFSLGVASGYPSAAGLVLWTRLAPVPAMPGGGMAPEVVPVRWELALDEAFHRIERTGTAFATPQWAHSVHVQVDGLTPDRWYWYRFHAGDVTSPVGRTRTTPAPEARVQQLRYAFASCQHYEQGWYAAYRHMIEDDLDLILHLGDYVYESSWGTNRVRRHDAPEPVTLDDYRARFALYKSDPELQAAHAHCPWLLTWDDHELDNDYAADRSQDDDDPAWFLQRRAAAYQAYYEHMPLPRAMVPFGPHLRLYRTVEYGQLARFYMLDDRQYRSYQPCPRPGRGGGNLIRDCAQRLDPRATLLGERQERWLEAALDRSGAAWNVLAQQTVMAQADALAGPGQEFFSDGWDGYPAARRRLLEYLGARRPANPVVIGGDAHSFWVSDLKPDFDDPGAPVVATEITGTSITSQPPPEERIRTAAAEGPHIRFATGSHRGYVRVQVTPARMDVDLRALASVADRDAGCHTLAGFAVEDGKPGAQRR